MRRRELLGWLGAVGLAGCLRLAEDDERRTDRTTNSGGADAPSGTGTGTGTSTESPGPGLKFERDWPQPDYDVANSGYVRSHAGPEGDPHIGWRTEMDEQVGQNGVVTAGGTAFVPDSQGTLDALALGTGERRWQAEVGDTLVDVTPAVHDGRVFVPAKQGVVTALTTDGRRLWEFETAEPPVDGHYYVLMGGVTAVDDAVYVGSGDGTVYALAPDDGTVRWATDVGAHVGASTPAVADGAVHVADIDGRLHALSETGDARWTVDLPGTDAVISAPAVRDGTVYVGGIVAVDGEPIEQPNTGYVSDRDLQGRLLAVDAASGDVAWSIDLPDAVPGSPAVTDDLVLTACRNGELYAHTTDGERYWFYGASGGFDGSPAVAGETVYLPDGGDVVGLDLESGRRRWRVALEHAADATPAVVDGGLLVGDHRNVETGEGGNCYLVTE